MWNRDAGASKICELTPYGMGWEEGGGCLRKGAGVCEQLRGMCERIHLGVWGEGLRTGKARVRCDGF